MLSLLSSHLRGEVSDYCGTSQSQMVSFRMEKGQGMPNEFISYRCYITALHRAADASYIFLSQYQRVEAQDQDGHVLKKSLLACQVLISHF